MYPLPNIKNEQKSDKKRVAAYCRVSSSSYEQMESYRMQIAYYEKHIKENPDYDFVGIFADEGISGTTTRKREAFNRMMEFARNGLIDMIITKSLSRFGRNTLDCLNNLRELKSLGVDVYFEKENIHTNRSEGEMLITLISAVAENESVALSENVKWGKRRKFERGDISCIPWKNITGYCKNENGEVMIVESEAAIIRRVYKEFLDGYGIYKIARNLNRDNVPLLIGGKEWQYRTIMNFLINEKYKGDIKFQKYFAKNPVTKKRILNDGYLPQYYVEGSHPAIIDSVVWDCVQLEIECQKNYCNEHFITQYHHIAYEDTFPLTNKIICGNCGHNYKIKRPNRKNERGKKYYECSEHRSGYRRKPKPGTCVNKSRFIPEFAEKVFVNAWNHLVDNKEHYLQEWQQTIAGEDILKAYRAKELIRLIEETGHIETMPYELMLKTLDHIEIGLGGRLEVIFLAGTKVNLV